jgi:plasmid stabilization system protein ParE
VTRDLRILPEAEAELLAAAEWYESKQPGLGSAFVEAVGGALESIVEAPQTSPLWRRGYPYRRHVLRRFPYIIVFTVAEPSVEVTAIAHSKRRPGYWVRRTASRP